MIKSFKSKALERFWAKNDRSGIRADHIEKVAQRLTVLDAAKSPEDMNIPGYAFHSLSGRMAGRYAVKVNKNWRITFSWDKSGPAAIDIDYEDYH